MTAAGIYYTNGTRGPKGDVRDRRVVARRHARRVSQAADVAAPTPGGGLEPQSRRTS